MSRFEQFAGRAACVGFVVAAATEALLPANSAGVFGALAASDSPTSQFAALGLFLLCCSGESLWGHVHRPCAQSVKQFCMHLWHCARFPLYPSPTPHPWPTDHLTPLSATPAAAVGLAARTQRPAARHRLLEAVIASLISSRRSLGGVTQNNVDQGVDYVLSSVLTSRVLGSTDMDEEQYI